MKKHASVFAVLSVMGVAAEDRVLRTQAPKPIAARAGDRVAVILPIRLADAYHVNSDKPADAFLIPLALTWAHGPMEVLKVVYPKAQVQTLKFSSTPVSVFSGEFSLITQFKVSGAASGKGSVKGRLRYQACTDGSCLPPQTVNVEVPYEIQK